MLWSLIAASTASALLLEAAEAQYPIREGAGPMHPTPEELARNVEADFHDISRELHEYASTHNRLPATLPELPKESRVIGHTNNGTGYKVQFGDLDWLSVGTGCTRHYGYAVSADGLVAVLVSVGLDGKPDTPDDFVKVIDARPSTNAKIEDETVSALRKIVYANWPCI